MFKALSIAAFAVMVAGSVQAADPPGRRAPPAAPVALNCGDRDLNPDVFGFTQGSDTQAVGPWSLSISKDFSFTARSTRLWGFFDVVQPAFAFTPCFEVSPYVYAGAADARDREQGGGRSRYLGGGLELKYKFLSRDIHGVGLTVDVNGEYQTGRNRGILGPDGNLGGSGSIFGVGGAGSYNFGARLFLDRELVRDTLYGAFNIEHLSAISTNLDKSPDGSQLNLRAALSMRVAPSLFVGGEALYSRSYLGAGYKTFQGDAFFVGPNMLWDINENLAFNAVYQVQISGKTQSLPGQLNLLQYNQHVGRVKLTYQF